MHEQLWIVVNDFEEFTMAMTVLRNIKDYFYKNNLVQYEQVIVFTLKDRSTSPALFVPRQKDDEDLNEFKLLCVSVPIVTGVVEKSNIASHALDRVVILFPTKEDNFEHEIESVLLYKDKTANCTDKTVIINYDNYPMFSNIVELIKCHDDYPPEFPSFMKSEKYVSFMHRILSHCSVSFLQHPPPSKLSQNEVEQLFCMNTRQIKTNDTSSYTKREKAELDCDQAIIALQEGGDSLLCDVLKSLMSIQQDSEKKIDMLQKTIEEMKQNITSFQVEIKGTLMKLITEINYCVEVCNKPRI